MKPITEITNEYKQNNLYSKDIAAHGKKQRETDQIKIVDEKLKELGYELDDKFFHELAVLNGKVVKIVERSTSLKVFNLDTDNEALESFAKDYLQTKEIANLVAENTTASHAPEMKF